MDNRYYKFYKRLDGTHRQVTEYGKFGIVDDKGMLLAPICYDEIIPRLDGNFDVRIDNRWGIIDISGDEIVSVYYKSPIVFNKKGYAIVERTDSMTAGVIKNDGKIIVPPKYSFVEEAIENNYFHHYEFESPLFFVHQSLKETSNFDEQDYRIGVYNFEGEIIAPVIYHSFIIDETYLLGERNGYYDLYDGVNNRGVLIGGFHHFFHHKDRLFFYYGGYYTSYTDRHDNERVVFVERDGVWIFTDLEMNSILKDCNGNNRNLKGEVHDLSSHDEKGLNHIYSIFPKCMTFVHDDKWPNFLDSYVKVKNFDFWDTYYLIDEETGICSEAFHEIESTGIKNIFFVEKTFENGSSGILKGTTLILPTEYFAFTNPIKGYSFGARKIGSEQYDIELINLNCIENKTVAYRNLQKSEVMKLFWDCNLYIYPIKDVDGKKSIRIKRAPKIEKDFEQSISSEDITSDNGHLNYSDWNCRYWFPKRYYMKETKKKK